MYFLNENNLSEIKIILENFGFNLFGNVKISDFESFSNSNSKISSFYPDCETIILFGSGGKNFWNKIKDFKTLPEGTFLELSENPIDDYTEYCASQLKKKFPNIIEKYLFPFKNEEIFINYQQLAVFSGLGHFSPYLKLVLHPEYGSWISLRGVLLSKYSFRSSTPLSSRVPCLECPKPCFSACPAETISFDGIDIIKCFEYRNQGKNCLCHCYSRKECIIGKEHIYSDEEGFHRSKSSLKMMRKFYLS